MIPVFLNNSLFVKGNIPKEKHRYSSAKSTPLGTLLSHSIRVTISLPRMPDLSLLFQSPSAQYDENEQV